jgi:hypothetical protein
MNANPRAHAAMRAKGLNNIIIFLGPWWGYPLKY